MPEHSPEPFCLVGLAEIGSAATPDTVKRTDNFDEEWLVAICRSPEDARRIVACVNACRGFSTEDLESMENGIDDDGEEWSDLLIHWHNDPNLDE